MDRDVQSCPSECFLPSSSVSFGDDTKVTRVSGVLDKGVCRRCQEREVSLRRRNCHEAQGKGKSPTTTTIGLGSLQNSHPRTAGPSSDHQPNGLGAVCSLRTTHLHMSCMSVQFACAHAKGMHAMSIAHKYT